MAMPAIIIHFKLGLPLSFDPNLRPPLWDSLETAKEQVLYGLQFCDILKISDNEIQFVSGKEDYDEGIQYLQETYHIPLILLTLGKDGSRAYYKDMCVEHEGYKIEHVVDTTGAGDAFNGGLLAALSKGKDIWEAARFANALAALSVQKIGTTVSMPTREEIEAFLK